VTPVNLYCYYRVAPERAGAARVAVAHAFRAVEERFGVVPRLYRGEHEAALWMEVYEQVRDADRLESVLSELCAAAEFAGFLASGSVRRIERFVAAA
jgi:hypothetical protein